MPAFRARRALATSRFFVPILSLILSAAGCSRDHDDQPAAQQRLFVTVPEAGTIAVYRDGATGHATPLDVIKEAPPDRPVAVAVDVAGSALVANSNGNVRVYSIGPDGKYRLLKSFEGPNTRMVHPAAIAANAVGSFYVADLADGHGRVEWFSGGASGDIPVDKVLEGPRTGISVPSGVAIDGAGRAFVADRMSDRVLVFDANASGDAAPLTVIEGLHAPEHVLVDDVLNVYVSNSGDNSIAVFGDNGPKNWSLSATITSDSLRRPSGIALDAGGEMAVGASGGVWFFPSAAHGRVDPLRRLEGASPMNPGGIYIH
jgi:DNA-binding beta-propeller fold protein YncE